MEHARYAVVEDSPNQMVIQDLGPWTQYPSVTNDAEYVVSVISEADPAVKSGAKKLFYYDSEGDCDQLLVVNGVFQGFAPGERRSTM